MDDAVVEDNWLRIKCNFLIHRTLVLCYESGNKSLMDSFKEAVEERSFKWKENGKRVELDEEELLLKVIDGLNTTIINQIACYAFEIVKESNKQNFMTNSFKGKEYILVSDDIKSDYELLAFIRNAISHNDDLLDKSQYEFSCKGRFYTFRSHKEGKEDSLVVIGKKELVHFLGEYIINLRCLANFNPNIEVNLENIYLNKNINGRENCINIKDKQTGENITPDDNQKQVIEDIVNYLRNNMVENLQCIRYSYPYKQNVLNNYFRMYDFYYLVTGLFAHRNETYSQYMNFLLDYGTFANREIRQKQDIGGLFAINSLFQIFSSTNNSTLDMSKMIFEYNKFNKIRNSVIHGTYYKDFEGNFYFYDGPRGEKNEDKLKFLQKIPIYDIKCMDRMFNITKAISQNRIDILEEEIKEQMEKLWKNKK